MALSDAQQNESTISIKLVAANFLPRAILYNDRKKGDLADIRILDMGVCNRAALILPLDLVHCEVPITLDANSSAVT